MVSTVLLKNPRKVMMALAEHGPMNKWKIKEKVNLEYPRVHEAISKLENEGYVKVYDIETSDKGLNMKIYGLTFRGVTSYLASVSLEPPPAIGEPGESIEAFSKRYTEEKHRYLAEIEKLAKFLEFYGELLDYPIFKEARWLAERCGVNVYHDILDVAKLTEMYPPFPSAAMQIIKELKKQKQTLKKKKWQMLKAPQMRKKSVVTIIENGKTREVEFDPFADVNKRLNQVEQKLEILLNKENEFWKWEFAERFFERLVPLKGRGKMNNENLRKFAEEGYRRKMELEVEPWKKAVDLFSG